MKKLRTEDEIIASWKGDIGKPLVSVCCATYNHVMYIEDALEGFLIQETNFPFEILIHDDASTDRTSDIIREYAVKYPRLIKPIYQTENQYSKGIKISPSFNLPRAKGDYIAMCEGDDFWIDSKKLQIQYQFMSDHDECSLSFHDSIVRDEILMLKGHSDTRFCSSLRKKDFTTEDVIKNWFIPTQSMFIRRSALSVFPQWTNFIINVDWAIHMICSLQGKIMYVDKVMSVYRHHENGVSNKFRKSYFFTANSLIRVLLYFDDYSEYRYRTLIKRQVTYLLLSSQFGSVNNFNRMLFLMIHPVFCIKKISVALQRKKWI